MRVATTRGGGMAAARIRHGGERPKALAAELA